ncbi:Protein mrp homolog [Candidatus Terasakiella magnetica]|uniref:Iron-sulfur cluster carrier protein n=1 Tax=Candidatus Terasakiella magnetica TaxID=1867952 RepID=A0A1C3RGU7_9PROT|nr:iron-sulfur cluster carrier protein ApbC [Candidatus Terasakiella magnetica]SCA56501.1 Protein mrp homolog [Candidatus Terasakiella magnetica]
MSAQLEQKVLETLKTIKDPAKDVDIVTGEMVLGLQSRDGHVAFTIDIGDPSRAADFEPVRKAAEEAVHALEGVLSVTAVLTAERPAQPQQAAPQQQGVAEEAAPLMPGVKSIVAVSSGKGGVGKSTTSVNLALALAAKGLQVGLLDADIYGPSIPRMLGITGQPVSYDGKVLEPMENHGIKCMSIGFLVEEDTAMIWRGPMVMGALEQLMRDVNWGELDVLVVDMPPGTGDVQLTMAQKVPLTGSVIVSTPQDIALLDTRKGLNMFRKVEIPVFGIVENMSYFSCPHCGERTDIFSHGGARATAEAQGADFLGEIPLDIKIRETSDGGHPIVTSDPDSTHAKAYAEIADKVWFKTMEQLNASQGPKIVFD